jgi:hypothetical protein
MKRIEGNKELLSWWWVLSVNTEKYSAEIFFSLSYERSDALQFEIIDVLDTQAK